MFVVLVKHRDHKVEDFEISDRTMAATGFDHDGGSGLDIKPQSIQFDLAIALKNEIVFGHFVVVMRPRIFADVDHVHGGNIIRIEEGTLGGSTGTVG